MAQTLCSAVAVAGLVSAIGSVLVVVLGLDSQPTWVLLSVGAGCALMLIVMVEFRNPLHAASTINVARVSSQRPPQSHSSLQSPHEHPVPCSRIQSVSREEHAAMDCGSVLHPNDSQQCCMHSRTTTMRNTLAAQDRLHLNSTLAPARGTWSSISMPHPLCLQASTVLLNTPMAALGSYLSPWIQTWFTLGLVVTSTLASVAIAASSLHATRIMLCWALGICTATLPASSGDTPVTMASWGSLYSVGPVPGLPTARGAMSIVALIPGINLDMVGFLYFSATVMVSAVFHELGHALCASSFRVPVISTGLFLFIAWPGAFVELHSAVLAHRTSFDRLRIACAGIWHNIVLATVAYAALVHLPSFLWLFYNSCSTTQAGVLVVSVEAFAMGDLGKALRAGDVITAIDGIDVVDGMSGWKSAFSTIADPSYLASDLSFGRCVPGVHLNAVPRSACCSQNTEALCLWNIEAFEHEGLLPRRCAPLEASFFDLPRCANAHDCSYGDICMAPKMAMTGDRILKLTVRSLGSDGALDDTNGDRIVTFSGDPMDIFYHVLVSEHIPRWSRNILFIWIPIIIETFLRYVVSLNGALAVLNSVPAFNLDGRLMLHEGMRLIWRLQGGNPSCMMIKRVADWMQKQEAAIVAVASVGLCGFILIAVAGTIKGTIMSME
ncbi:hypothetical protein BASA61_010100 [Batrachochytrium salamandrivorans]|nr:hypothetical protein BASA61_010100 [Batrachochytrium salamandrivorans]